MAKIENIALHTLMQTKNAVQGQLNSLLNDQADLNNSLSKCGFAIDQCIADLTIIDMSIVKLQEPVKPSKKKEK